MEGSEIVKYVFPAALALTSIHAVVIFFLVKECTSARGGKSEWKPYYYSLLAMKWTFLLAICASLLCAAYIIIPNRSESINLRDTLPILSMSLLVCEILALLCWVFWIVSRVKKKIKSIEKSLSKSK